MSDALLRADGTRIAVARRDGHGPTIIFLPGYASDMAGTKALALDAWAGEAGRAMVRFDYGGCGTSDGAFAEQGLDDWLADTLMVIDAVSGPVLLVGSSMGGWLMLLAALRRPDRVAGLVGIAAAPDFTEWGFDDARRRAMAAHDPLEEPSPYGGTIITSRRFWNSGQMLRLLDAAAIDIDVPVRLIQGQRDPDVPWRLALDIAARVRSDDVQVRLIKDGDHRLSRDEDLAVLIDTVSALLGR